jgi:RNA polymerase sigma factor (sigma-70 family)
MDPPLQQNLNEINTHWTVVRQAHGDEAVVGAARGALMERYSGAVYRYLLGALRDRDAADDLFQEFCLRFLRGDFRNADPQKGRFRDFVKTALFHLIVDHQNRRRDALRVVSLEAAHVAAISPGLSCSDQQFLESWRNEILGRTWQALERNSEQGGHAYYRVLRCRSDHPEVSSSALAEQLSTELGKPIKADWVRQTLRRAREQFTDLLVEELAATLEEPTPQRLEEELQDLGMLDYCRDALNRRVR